MSKKASIQVCQQKIKEKANLCRSTLSKIKNNPGDKKYQKECIDELKLQINELERYSLTSIADINQTLNSIFQEVKDPEEEKFIKNAKMIPPAAGDEYLSSPTSGPLRRTSTIGSKKASLNGKKYSHEDEFTGYLDEDGLSTVQRTKSDSNVEEIFVEE